MFDFLRRRRLLRRGLASKKTRRRRTRNELLRSLESARYVKVIVLAAFIAGLAFLIFSGQQPEPTKNFVIALLFFATAIVQLWINQPRTFSQNSRVFLVFGTIFVQLAATKAIVADIRAGKSGNSAQAYAAALRRDKGARARIAAFIARKKEC